MKQLLYIDGCIRNGLSRTKRIAEPIVNALKERYEVTTLTLNELPLSIVKEELITQRNSGSIDPTVLRWAELIRDADRIVIAAPFWDMSFPAALKNFLELCSIFDVTFCSNDHTCYGNCKAEKLLYITSRGMNIKTGDPLEQATPYLAAISWLWGIGPMEVIAAENMDYSTAEEIEEKIAHAIEEGLTLAKTF